MGLQTIGDVTVDTVAEYVAALEIHRAPHNYFDVALIDDLVRACEQLADTDCRAVVLCSEGRNFCAGANFATGGPGDFRKLYERACLLFEQPLPIVAAVQGAAIGGGLGLTLAADFRVACTRSRFSANFALLGFHHGFGMSESLPHVIGSQRAAELLYTGARIGGARAFEIGLCDRLVDDEAQLRVTAIELASAIAAAAPLAVRSIRQTLRGPLAARVRNAVERESAEQTRLSGTADWQEGLRASSERRPARFQGR